MMLRHFLLIVIVLQIFSPWANGARSACTGLLNGSYWLLPPKGQRLVIGVFAETVSHKKVLAVNDYYWGSHEKLDHSLRDKYPIKRVLWAGEALIENDSDRQARGVLVMTINASGYVWSKSQQAPSQYRNDPRSLKRNLERFKPHLISRYTQHFSYNSEHAHLDPFFQSLHERLKFSKDDTVRHRFLNVLQVLVTLSNYFTKNPSLSIREQISRMERVSVQMMGDMLLFLNSQSRYSRVKPSADIAALLTTFKNLKRPDRKAEQDLLVKVVEVIRAAITKASLADEEPEIIVLNPGRKIK